MIEILKFTPSNKDGYLKGFVDVFIDKTGLEIYGITLFEKDGKRWASFPSRKYQDKDTGQDKYFQHLRFRERAHQDAFGSAVYELAMKWAEEHPVTVTPATEQPVTQEVEDPAGQDEKIPF